VKFSFFLSKGKTLSKRETNELDEPEDCVT